MCIHYHSLTLNKKFSIYTEINFLPIYIGQKLYVSVFFSPPKAFTIPPLYIIRNATQLRVAFLLLLEACVS
jgi:hypothetical protein